MVLDHNVAIRLHRYFCSLNRTSLFCSPLCFWSIRWFAHVRKHEIFQYLFRNLDQRFPYPSSLAFDRLPLQSEKGSTSAASFELWPPMGSDRSE